MESPEEKSVFPHRLLKPQFVRHSGRALQPGGCS
jgi:hypothetical protein